MRLASDAELSANYPLGDVERVIFFKRDELTTDLICCEVTIAGKNWAFHEEQDIWPHLLKHVEQLPGFKTEWFASVVQPPFGRNEFVAFSRD